MNGKLYEQSELSVVRIAALRLAVGLLGERDAAGWWTSAFLSPTSTSFLAPVFGGNTFQARYQGVLEAAKRVHDERIGVGHVFHGREQRRPPSQPSSESDAIGHGLTV